MNGQDEFLFTSGASSCCGAPVYDDYMICSSCKEHTSYYEDEEPETVGTYNKKPKTKLFKIRLNQLKKFKK